MENENNHKESKEEGNHAGVSDFPALTELIKTLPDGASDSVESVEEQKQSSRDINDSSYDDSIHYPKYYRKVKRRTLTEEQLKELFSPFGEVVNAEIKRDKITKTGLGYAFVQFKTRHEAAAAKRNLHKTVVANRPIRIGWAQKNTNLFVGDLDPSVTSEMLREAFRAFGDLYEDETFAKNQNYGFVKFKRRIDAEMAKREMDGRVLGGRRIRTGWGDSNTQRHCVHIQFDPASPTSSSPHMLSPHSSAGSSPNGTGVLTETDLHTIFSPYGTVLNVHLPRTASRLRGFGFVRYNDTDDGERNKLSAERNEELSSPITAKIAALHNTRVAGVLISCNFGKKQQHSKHRNGVAPLSSTLTPHLHSSPPSYQRDHAPTHSENSPDISDDAPPSFGSPPSPKDSRNQQRARENGFTPSPSNNGDDTNNSNIYAAGDKQDINGKARPIRHKQNFVHQLSPQKHSHHHKSSNPLHHINNHNSHNHATPPHHHSSQNASSRSAQYPSHHNSHSQHLASQFPPSRQRAPPHSHIHSHTLQPQPSIIDTSHHSPQQSLGPPMYHGSWIATQGWIPYIVPQYYPAIHTLDDNMNMDMSLNGNTASNLATSYHMQDTNPLSSAVYLYDYSTPMAPINHLNHVTHVNHVNHVNHVMDPSNTVNVPFHQSYAYAYSSHAT